MTRDSTAPPPVGEPPEPGATSTVPDPALDAIQVPTPVPSEPQAAESGSVQAEPPVQAEHPIQAEPAEAHSTQAPSAASPVAAVPKHAPDIDPTKLDPDAMKVVYRLRQFGHEAYLVGGCVRDLLLGLK